MNEHNSPTRLPEVLLDAVAFGLRFDISPFSQSTMEEIRIRLAAKGLLTSGTDAHRLTLEVPLGSNSEFGVASVELVPANGRSGRFGSMSNIQINGMRLLRKAGYGDMALGLGLDGSDNFIGATASATADLLPIQLDLMAGAVNAVVQALEEAIPETCEVKEIHLWLKSAEACLDLEVSDAPAVPRWLQRSGFPGAARICTDFYRASASEEGELVAIRYWRQATGPCAKIYAKGPDLLRVEVACVCRKALRVLGCKADGQSMGEEAVKMLLMEFAELSAALLQDVHAHALEAVESTTSVDDLFVALWPLLELRMGFGASVGRPPEAPARDMAGQAIEAFFSSGRFLAKDCRPGYALRRVLDELSTLTGPLIRSGRRAIYCLSPRYARAAHSIAMRA